MQTFSERMGYEPDRSQLCQLDGMDYRLRMAVWNFLYGRYFSRVAQREVLLLNFGIWEDLMIKRADEIFSSVGFDQQQLLHQIAEQPRRIVNTFMEKNISGWYFRAPWNKAYDLLEYALTKATLPSTLQQNFKDANKMLAQEGSGYRFVGEQLTPITNDLECAEVESAYHHNAPFDLASKHIDQAVRHLSDRDNPDFRNAIKESISAVESAVKMASGEKDLPKGLNKLSMHSQLGQAWANMYNWTSDEEGIRHGMTQESPAVGLSEARYMVVTCSAFVNYLVAEYGQGATS